MLRLSLLGNPQISWRGSRVESLRALKSRALLYYLAVMGRPQPRLALAGMFWGEKSDAQAQVNLRQALHQLRAALPGCCVAGRTSVAIASDIAVEIDAVHFAQLARRGLSGDTTALRAAADAYSGEFLAGVFLDGAPTFEEWLLQERESLRSLALDCLRALLADAVQRHAIAPGIQYARRLLALEPWLEEAHRQLMQLLVWDGQPGAALAQYERCRQMLADELRIVPGAAITALRRQILASMGANTPRATSPAPIALRPRPLHNLPVQLTSFVGREADLAAVGRLLFPSEATGTGQPQARLVTLTGTGGVGKTRLALEAAEALRGAFRHGVYLIELAPLSEPSQIPAAVAAALGVYEQARLPLIDLLCEHLRDCHLLLLLDNCEHLVDACAGLAGRLLRACPDLRILATSREALLVAGEARYPVRPLATPGPAPADVPVSLAEHPATRLFLERARALQPDLELSAADTHAVTQICQRLDGLPLAIELATIRTLTMSVAEIADQLNDRFHVLGAPRSCAEPRHQTLRTLIEWSAGLLADPERVLLRRLAVFVGGWTIEACEAVCADTAGNEIAPPQVLPLLLSLVDKSLVVRHEGGPAPRYGLLETIRQYAGEQLAAAGEVRAVSERHLAYLTGLAEAAEPHLRGAAQKEWLQCLEAEHDNLRAAVAWALEAMPEGALRLAGALGQFWQSRGYFSEGRETLESALARAPERPARWRASALRWSGRLAYRTAENELARGRLRAALALSQTIGDTAGAAAALNYLAVVVEGEGAYEQSQQLLQESLALYRSIGDHWGCASVLNNLAQGERMRSDYAAAAHYAEQSLALQQMIGDLRGIALSLDALGEVATVRGNYAEAERYLTDALALQEQIGDRQGIGYSLTDLGQLALARGDLDAAQQFLGQRLGLNEELASAAGAACTLCYLGAVALARGDLDQAAQLLEQSLAIQQRVGIQSDLAYTLCYLGAVALAYGDRSQAAQLLGRCLSIQRHVRDQYCVATCLVNVGALVVGRGEHSGAVRLVAAAAAICERGGIALAAHALAARERTLAAARAQLDESALAAALGDGSGLTVEQAIEAGLQAVVAPAIAETGGVRGRLAATPSPPPAQLTVFIERPAELAEIQTMLRVTRMLTLAGPGGAGKTRLALRAAELLGGQFANGVCFVDLAVLSEPALLPHAVAAALGLSDRSPEPVADTLCAHLGDRRLLLLLDNCEHLTRACEALAGRLLAAAPHLTIIATSRELLQADGAICYQVPPLSMPDARRQHDLVELAAYAAIALFCARAAAAQPAFALTQASAPAVVQICHLLNGQPLAIELAAARVGALTVQQIAARLDARLQLLGSGSRDAHPRHQSLRAAIDWSYNLLSAQERDLLQLLAVFPGGGTAALLAATAAPPGAQEQREAEGQARSTLQALANKSLVTVRHDGAEPRYGLQVSIRDYALEKLAAAGAEAQARARHLRALVDHAEAIERRSRRGDQAQLVRDLEADLDNLRAALDWSRRAPATHAEAPELGLRLAGAIWPVWALQLGLDEGQAQIEALLALEPARRTAARAKALYGLSALVGRQDDPARRPQPLLEESAAIWRELGDQHGEAHALIFLGATLERADPRAARAQIEAGLALFRRLGDRAGIGEALHYLGRNALNGGDSSYARACYEESRDLWRALRNGWGLADSLNALGTIALAEGDLPQAIADYEASLAQSERLGIRLTVATTRCNLSNAELRLGRLKRAAALARASLEIFAELGNKSGIAHCLAILARCADLEGKSLAAAQLDGAAQALREQFTLSFGLAELAPFAFRPQDGDPVIGAARHAGRARTLTTEQAIALALS